MRCTPRLPLDVFRALLEHFEHDAAQLQVREQRGRLEQVGEHARMHVEEQPLALGAEQREVLEMQRLREPVQLQLARRALRRTSSGDTARSSASCAQRAS